MFDYANEKVVLSIETIANVKSERRNIVVKILVTGANGYLGKGIIEGLLDIGMGTVDVVATDFKTDRIDKRVTRIECDLFQVNEPFYFFGRPDVIVHLAWKDGFKHYSDNHINNLPDHYLFLKQMAEAGTKQITVMGSMHEIGFYEGSINESTPCNPTTPYGVAKNALRELMESLCRNQRITFQWMRGYYIVGNFEYGSSIFSKIASAVKEGKTEFPFTLGLNQFDFLDYNQFCDQVVKAVLQTEICGIINICSGRPEKLADRVERFIKENGYNIRLNYGAFPDRPYDSKAIWGDDKKIKKILVDFEKRRTE